MCPLLSDISPRCTLSGQFQIYSKCSRNLNFSSCFLCSVLCCVLYSGFLQFMWHECESHRNHSCSLSMLMMTYTWGSHNRVPFSKVWNEPPIEYDSQFYYSRKLLLLVQPTIEDILWSRKWRDPINLISSLRPLNYFHIFRSFFQVHMELVMPHVMLQNKSH